VTKVSNRRLAMDEECSSRRPLQAPCTEGGGDDSPEVLAILLLLDLDSAW
jgi:hypothetical protein